MLFFIFIFLFLFLLLLESIIILYAERPYFKEESWISGISYLDKEKNMNFKNKKDVRVLCGCY